MRINLRNVIFYFQSTICNWLKTRKYFVCDLYRHYCLGDLPPAVTDNILMKALLFCKNYSQFFAHLPLRHAKWP